MSSDDELKLVLQRAQVRMGGEIRGDKLYPIGPHLTALRPLTPMCELVRRWHVVQVEPQQEFNVAERVSALHFDVFSPKWKKKIRVNAVRHRVVERPLLPGYILAGFDADQEWWQRIVADRPGAPGMRGVLRLLKWGERPIPVADAIVEHLRMRELQLAGGRRKHPPILIKPKAPVRILEPLCFAGLFGVVTAVRERLRQIDVEIDIFGRPVPLRVAPEQVEAI